MNEVCQCDTSVGSEFELEFSKLALVNEIVKNCMKLESITNNFFNKISQCI